jgi:hypothetical protein
MDSTPRLGDSDNNLLFKICDLLASGGGGGSGITQAFADARYVFKTGDTLTGPLTLPGLTSSNDVAINPNWTDGLAHTGLKVNVTDTSSDAASFFVDFQVGGLSKFNVPKSTGFVTVPGVLEVKVFTWAKTVDASTNTSPVALEIYHETSGGAGGGATNDGVSFDLRADSDTTDRQLQARFASLWSTATHATRTSNIRISAVLNGTTTEALRVSVAAVDIRGTTALQLNGVAYFNPLTAFAAGTVYTLTATSAAVDFGTTDPSLVISAAGTYSIRAMVKVSLNGATFVANQTLTIKLRRTNNTAADVANSTTTYVVPIVTTLTNTLAVIPLPEILYTTALTNDAVTIFADIAVLPSAGSITISEASLIAVRIS